MKNMVTISRSFLILFLCLISLAGISQNKSENDARSKARAEKLKKTLKWIEAKTKKNNSKYLLPPIEKNVEARTKNVESFNSDSVQTDTANKESKGQYIQVLKADVFRRDKQDSLLTLNILVGNVVMKQENSLFYCDSAIQNISSNIIEAFGKVHINDSDSIHTYSDYLKYFGETRIATLRDNVRLTDGKVNLTTDELEYDLNAKLGTYLNGGKVVNGKSVLTSKQGYYYADTKDVYFQKNVLLVDPEYIMTTDTLLYNVKTEVASFLAVTTIRDDKTRIKTRSGFYDMKAGKAKFTNRPILVDSVQTVIADNLNYDKISGQGIAEGNVFYRDSSQGVSMLSGGAIFNTITKDVTSYKSPVLIMKQDEENFYIAADTLFSAYQKIIPPKQIINDTTFKKDTLIQVNAIDSIKQKEIVDSVIVKDTITTTISKKQKRKNKTEQIKNSTTFINSADSVIRKDSTLIAIKIDSSIKQIGLEQKSVATSSILINDTAGSIKKTDSLVFKDSVSGSVNEDTTYKKNTNDINSGGKISALNDTSQFSKTTQSIAKKDTVIQEIATDSVRYFRGYHNVRMYSDSLQGKCDSVYYSLIDSVFKFYKDPVIWSNENQISGSQLMLTTKNKKAHQFIVEENALSVSNTGDGLFNQIRGSKMVGSFTDGEIENVHVTGNAISLYYLQDDDSAYVGMDYTEANDIIMRFKNRELKKVIWVKGAKGTTYPFNKIPDNKSQLPNFKWLDAIRPKSAGELFGK